MNFFGALGQLGRILPGYVQGRESAINSNWQDLSNYNKIYHGQLANAYDAATWEPQMQDRWKQSALLDLAAKQAEGNYMIWDQSLPQRIRDAIPQYELEQQYRSLLLQQMLQYMPGIIQNLTANGMPVQMPPLQPPQQTQPTTVDPRVRLEQP